MLHTMNISQLSLEIQAQYLDRADTPMEQKTNMTSALLSRMGQKIVQLTSKNQALESGAQQKEQDILQLKSQLERANAGKS